VTLARTIKSDATLRDIHLVLLTSLGKQAGSREMKDAGFSACLAKPIRQSDLFDSLAAVLAGRHLLQETKPMAAPKATGEPLHGAARILLAEDNITNQNVAVAILKKMGLWVDAVANGAEAVAALETIPYDLVLMDVQMPVMDGMAATLKIRNPNSSVRNHQIPIIAMTAGVMQGDREQCLAAGMNDYLPKPIDPRIMANVLEKWLRKDADKGKGKHIDGQDTPTHGTHMSLPIFDKAGLLSRLMNDEALAQEIIQTFLEDMPKQMNALNASLKAGDVSGAERQAHTIRGASANVGGEALRAAAFEMEKTAHASDLDATKGLMAALETALRRLKDAMEKQITQ